MAINPQLRRQFIAWALVTGQFVLIGALLFIPISDSWAAPTGLAWISIALTLLGLVGLVVAAFNLGPGLTASPVPNKAGQLRTSGAFGYVRHPIYTALLTFATGQVIAAGSYPRVLVLLLLVALLNVKARWEEKQLVARFPDYTEYASRTPRFLPNPLRGRRQAEQTP